MTGRGKLLVSLAQNKTVDVEIESTKHETSKHESGVQESLIEEPGEHESGVHKNLIEDETENKDKSYWSPQACSLKQYYANFSPPLSDSEIDDSDADPDYLPVVDKPINKFLSIEELELPIEEENPANEIGGRTNTPDNVEVLEREIPDTIVDPIVNNDGEKKNTRKRIRNAENWTKNIKKTKINSGLSYMSRMGKVHEAKKLKPPCDNCSFGCTEKISADCRESLLRDFYNLADKTRQRDFISKCITCISPKQKNSGRKRLINKSYHFIVNEKRIRVCKKFFTSTLDVSNNTVTTVISKTNETGYVEKEKRGKHSNHINKTDEKQVQDIVTHIESFPRIESHYCRSRTKKEYLEGSLNLTMMYRLYKDKCLEEGNVHIVKKPIYEKIFNTQFNIGFHKPKKDQCSVCESYKNNPDKENINCKLEHEAHLRNVKLSRIEKDYDKNICKEKEDVITCCYDLQAVMTVPQGDVAKFYYKSKLNMFNFTIFDLFDKQGHCYLWHEGMAKRGANEITTCVYLFLKELDKQKKHVIFYSDNCVAQNKNKYLFSMYLYCVENLDIDSIIHKYLVIGHTENEGDSMHACIEKEKTRVLKSGPIYVPSELSSVIKCAKKTGKPYKVLEMHSDNFINWKTVTEKMGKNFNVNTNHEKVKWNDVKMVKVCKSEKDRIFYKTTYEKDEDFKEIFIREKMRGNKICNVTLEPCYKGPQDISTKKKGHLIQLCEEDQIPKIHHDFFKNLKASDKPTNGESDNE